LDVTLLVRLLGRCGRLGVAAPLHERIDAERATGAEEQGCPGDHGGAWLGALRCRGGTAVRCAGPRTGLLRGRRRAGALGGHSVLLLGWWREARAVCRERVVTPKRLRGGQLRLW